MGLENYTTFYGNRRYRNNVSYFGIRIRINKIIFYLKPAVEMFRQKPIILFFLSAFRPLQKICFEINTFPFYCCFFQLLRCSSPPNPNSTNFLQRDILHKLRAVIQVLFTYQAQAFISTFAPLLLGEIWYIYETCVIPLSD